MCIRGLRPHGRGAALVALLPFCLVLTMAPEVLVYPRDLPKIIPTSQGQCLAPFRPPTAAHAPAPRVVPMLASGLSSSPATGGRVLAR